MYHILCIHSSLEGHLDCFQLLATINKATMNIVEHVICYMLEHLLGICLIVVYLGVQVELFPIFSGTDIFPTWFYQLVFPPGMEEYSFSTLLPASAVTWVFDLSHSDWCKVESQGSFYCIYLGTKDVEYFFKFFSDIQYSSVENSLLSSVPHF